MKLNEIDYNDGKWHNWNGGECPVHPETIVEYLWNGSKGVYHEMHKKAGKCLYAFRETGKFHMIAFRVIKEHHIPREYWIVKCPGKFPEVFGHDPKYHDGIEVIHVREVFEKGGVGDDLPTVELSAGKSATR